LVINEKQQSIVSDVTSNIKKSDQNIKQLNTDFSNTKPINSSGLVTQEDVRLSLSAKEQKTWDRMSNRKKEKIVKKINKELDRDLRLGEDGNSIFELPDEESTSNGSAKSYINSKRYQIEPKKRRSLENRINDNALESSDEDKAIETKLRTKINASGKTAKLKETAIASSAARRIKEKKSEESYRNNNYSGVNSASLDATTRGLKNTGRDIGSGLRGVKKLTEKANGYSQRQISERTSAIKKIASKEVHGQVSLDSDIKRINIFSSIKDKPFAYQSMRSSATPAGTMTIASSEAPIISSLNTATQITKEAATKIITVIVHAVSGITLTFLPILLAIILLVTLVVMILGGVKEEEVKLSGSYITGVVNVSDDVLAFEPTIRKYCEKYSDNKIDMTQYVHLVMAVMMQESGGDAENYPDVMQCSESGVAKQLYGIPTGRNTITDPEISIECGVIYLKSQLLTAKVESAGDLNNIKTALQCYNYGGEFYGYMKNKGYDYWTEEISKSFQIFKGGRYGDRLYPEHVLKYYSVTKASGGGSYIWPLPGSQSSYNISSGFGWRICPFHGKEFHPAIDISASTGTPVYASASGTVIIARTRNSFGNSISIEHSGNVYTMYNHLSSINVKEGDTVKKGDLIGKVGSTGDSTGPHLDFRVYDGENNSTAAVNPIDWINSHQSSEGDDIVEYALQFVGNPYVWGGNSLTNGVDCSGFTQQVYKHFGYSLPRVAEAQSKVGAIVSTSELQPGDLIFYGSPVGHVAIYIGDGKVVHASNPSDGIKISNVFYRTPTVCRRIID